MRFRVPEAGDLDALVALNDVHKTATSELDRQSLERLLERAFLALTTPGAQALLITFDQDADYDSPNFLWFRARRGRFVYVDRIIVATERQGQGLASRLYDHLFVAARSAGHTTVVCEVNSEPPNPASDAFHAELGFVAVGEAALANGKTVRYLQRQL